MMQGNLKCTYLEARFTFRASISAQSSVAVDGQICISVTYGVVI